MRHQPDSPQIRRGPLLAIILASYLMIVLDISIVITGLPKIRADLGIPVPSLSWVQNAYTLVFGGLLLLGGRAGDILGRRRMLLSGLVIFMASSLIVGLAPSTFWLLAGRALQGVGAAILAPSTLALLSTNFPEGPDRTRAIGYYGTTAGIGASVGLVLGGIFAGWLSWRVGFFLNLPLGLILLWGTRRYVHETPRRSARFDLFGAISSTLGMSLLVYGIVRSASAGWGEVYTRGSLSAAAGLLAVFAINEWRVAQPIMPLRLFSDGERVAALGARMLFLGAMVGFWFFSTQLLQNVMGLSSFATGFAFLPTTVANFIVALYVPRLTQRFGNGRLLATGLLISLAGMLWLAQVTSESGYLVGVALPMILIGAGQGLSLSPLTLSGVVRVGSADAGAASGLVNVAHQLGGSLGLGVLVAVFAVVQAPGLDGMALLAHRIGISLWVASAMLALAFVLVGYFIVPRSRMLLARA